MARKASDVSAADWRYQTYVPKKLSLFYVCSYGFSQSWKSLEKHRSLFSKTIYSDLLEKKCPNLIKAEYLKLSEDQAIILFKVINYNQLVLNMLFFWNDSL